ncbi:tyrosine-type recombinase/integrase [Methylorubrum zatmanii]
MLYTACRREDIPRFGPQHIRDGRLRFIQGKNDQRAPVSIDIPVHPDLAAAIQAAPITGQLVFLVTEYGKPFTTAGFGNKFKDWCVEAGLPHCSAHGCRKATAARLAERGATPHQIMAITGHKSLEEVERYTRAAQMAGLADSAMALLPSRDQAQGQVPPKHADHGVVGPYGQKNKPREGLAKSVALPRGIEPLFSP